MLDNKLPARGIVQVYFRITQYFEEVWSQMQNPGFNPLNLLKDSEFIELEYTFENVYIPAMIYIEHEIHEKLEDFVEFKVGEAVSLIVQMMIFFIVVSFFFTLFSFRNIIN